jgi:hypothetical protein
MGQPTLVRQGFSKHTLYESLAHGVARPDEVAQNRVAGYLFRYLSDLHTRTVLIEEPYTDADYLDDYSAYYCRCHAPFDRHCRRVHFLDIDLTDGRLRALRQGASGRLMRLLQKHYLGFVIARPLPETVVGRTILRTYDPDSGRRDFPATKSYKANLCGCELELKSLAFQEQDTVLAACATVALWSAFHKTAELFQTAIPTPAAITRAASQAVHYGRPIPSSGLELEEMCSAIRHLGLEPEVIDLRSGGMVPFPSLVYGYLAMGLPVILIVEIEAGGVSDLHAVTVAGYSVMKQARRPAEVPGHSFVPLLGRRIEKLYAHDDQIGPFARMRLEDSVGCPFPLRFVTDWVDQQGGPLPVYPYAVIVPVYNKIRLRYVDVLRWLSRFDDLASEVMPVPEHREWDLHLLLSNEYKKQVRADGTRPAGLRESILAAHHPRFWWRAVLRLSGKPLVELLFDATGIARSLPLTGVVWLSEGFAQKLEQEMAKPQNEQSILDALESQRLFRFLRTSLQGRARPFDRLPEP